MKNIKEYNRCFDKSAYCLPFCLCGERNFHISKFSHQNWSKKYHISKPSEKWKIKTPYFTEKLLP